MAAEPLIARYDSPAFDTSMMDGYAFNSDDLNGGNNELIISQRVAAGDSPAPLTQQTAARVFTGAPIPAGADTVVMQEECVESNNKVRLPDEITAGKNILLRGENIRADEVIYEQGSYLQPYHLGLAASQGFSSLEVFSKLSVALINTGNELVMPSSKLGPGQIYNSNYFTIRSMLEGIGCKTLSFNIVKDTLDETKATLTEAADKADIILSTGGVSVGDEDHVRNAVESLGEIALWRIRLKPGKPFAYGHEAGTSFIGLPGNPVSCFVTFCLLAKPFIHASQGITNHLPLSFLVTSGFDNGMPEKRDLYRSAKLIRDNDCLIAELIANQNSASLRGLLGGDRLIHIPAKQKIKKGMTLNFYPFSELC